MNLLQGVAVIQNQLRNYITRFNLRSDANSFIQSSLLLSFLIKCYQET